MREWQVTCRTKNRILFNRKKIHGSLRGFHATGEHTILFRGANADLGVVLCGRHESNKCGFGACTLNAEARQATIDVQTDAQHDTEDTANSKHLASHVWRTTWT